MKKSELRNIIKEELTKLTIEAKVNIKPEYIFTPESLYNQLEYTSNQMNIKRFNLVESPSESNVILVVTKHKKLLFKATVKNRNSFKSELIQYIKAAGGANIGLSYIDSDNAKNWV